MSRPTGRWGVLLEVSEERTRQDEKWGQQDHRDGCPKLLDREGGCSSQQLAYDLEIPTAARARLICQIAFQLGQGHWSAILQEEVSEAVAAIGNAPALRRELVQVAAVAVAWVEAIDRRGGE